MEERHLSSRQEGCVRLHDQYVCMYGWMDGWMDGDMYICIYVYVPGSLQKCHPSQRWGPRGRILVAVVAFDASRPPSL